MGGALYLDDTELTMVDSEITDSTAYHGGGIYAKQHEDEHRCDKSELHRRSTLSGISSKSWHN